MPINCSKPGWTVAKSAVIDDSVIIDCEKLTIEDDVVVGENTVLCGDSITLQKEVRIAENVDIRASNIIVGARSEIGRDVRVLVADRFKVGRASRISWECRITCREFLAGEFLYFAQDVHVGYGGTTESTATVHIGNRVALGPHNILNANHPIILEDQVGSGSYVTFWTHGFHFGHSVLDGYEAAYKPIHINQNVWLGYHVSLLPGVEIGKNTIIAAGAVVGKSIESNVLAGGVPAKAIRPLSSMPLDDSEAEKQLREILTHWFQELRWKGLEVEECSSGGNIASIHSGKIALEAPLTITLLNDESSTFERQTERHLVISVVSQKSEFFSSQDAVFFVRTHSLLGPICPVSEDLRDHLRRNTLGCGTDRTYSALEPHGFRRLKEMGRREP